MIFCCKWGITPNENVVCEFSKNDDGESSISIVLVTDIYSLYSQDVSPKTSEESGD